MRKIFISILICFCLILISNVNGFCGLLAPATEPTQIANFKTLSDIVDWAEAKIERLNKIVNQNMNMIEFHIADAMEVPKFLWANTANAIHKITTTANRAKSIYKSMEDIDDNFEKKFKGYKCWVKSQFNTAGFSKKYVDWENRTKAATKSLAEKSQLSFIVNDHVSKHQSELQKLAKSVSGRNAIIQTTNMLADQQTESLNELNEIMSSQMEAQSQFRLIEMEKEASNMAYRKNIYEPIRPENRPIIGDEAYTYMDISNHLKRLQGE